jgi:hypothetical protein
VESSVLLTVLLAFVAANLPFFTERIFFIVQPKCGTKHFGWRLAELTVLYFAVGGAARLLEGKVGAVQHQGWEFYAITVSLFLVFAYPGFVMRYLWRHRKN